MSHSNDTVESKSAWERCIRTWSLLDRRSQARPSCFCRRYRR
jgi:hypothetical protein